MKGQKVFALSVIALAVSQAVYAEVGMLPEVNVTSTTIDDRFDSSQTVRLGRGAVLELIG